MKKYEKDIPKILYKYRALNEFTKQMLLNGELYFATTNELKDPLEKFFRFTKGSYINDGNNKALFLDAEQYTKYYLNHTRTGENEPYGILSLCDSKSEKQVYIEYADEFNGICIGFDWDRFNLFFAGSHPPVKNIPRRVTYQSTIEIETTSPTPEQLLEIFTSKIPSFLYEKECRMFYTKGKLISNAIRYAIKEIIFGYKVSEKQIQEIKSWVHGLHEIRFFTAKLIGENVQIEEHS